MNQEQILTVWCFVRSFWYLDHAHEHRSHRGKNCGSLYSHMCLKWQPRRHVFKHDVQEMTRSSTTSTSCFRLFSALLSQLHFILPKEHFRDPPLSPEQLLHQLLPGAARARRPQGGALAQAERTQQPRVVQEGCLDEFMCRRRSRRCKNTKLENFIQWEERKKSLNQRFPKWGVEVPMEGGVASGGARTFCKVWPLCLLGGAYTN